MSNLSKKSDS